MSPGNVAPFPGYKYVCIDHKTLRAVIASVGPTGTGRWTT